MPSPPASNPCAEPRSAGRRTLLLAAAGTAALGACTFAADADADHNGDDAPRAQALPRAPRLAWVLSSGGPRGFTHVGVLRALHESKRPGNTG